MSIPDTRRDGAPVHIKPEVQLAEIGLLLVQDVRRASSRNRRTCRRTQGKLAPAWAVNFMGSLLVPTIEDSVGFREVVGREAGMNTSVKASSPAEKSTLPMLPPRGTSFVL